MACACGAPTPVVDDPNGDVLIDHEYAIISIRDGVEQIEMRLSLDTMTQNSGLIMPTPNPATVSLGDAQAFDALARQMTPEIVTIYDWWTTQGYFGSGGAPPSSKDGSPVILSTVQLGPLEATVLAASDPSGLTVWLEENGYGIRSEVTDLLATYIDRNWYFVAMKLTNEATLDGDLDPISFTFDIPASGPVYPLLLSQAARVAQTVNLYVFDNHMRDVVFDNGDHAPMLYGAPVWSGKVDEPALLKYGAYLAAYSFHFEEPITDIKGDLVFPRSPEDLEYGQVEYRTVYLQVLGIPLGWLLVAVVAVVAILITVRVVQSPKRTGSVPVKTP